MTGCNNFVKIIHRVLTQFSFFSYMRPELSLVAQDQPFVLGGTIFRCNIIRYYVFECFKRTECQQISFFPPISNR